MAGLVLLFVVALGGGVGWVVRDRAARQARAADELERDLDRAELFQGQGKRAEALAALDRAALLAGQAPPDAARDARLAAVRERLDADDRDEVFAARFEEIRLRDQSRVDVKESRFAAADGAAFPELRDALDRYGVTLGVTPPAEVAARIGGRPEPAQRTLVAALDDCLFAPKADPAARRWLPTALDAADGDTWRRQVREAGLAGDRAAVERLARGAEVEKQPPSFLLLVANNLPAQSAAARLELLRRTREAHPADLWANLWLADELTAGGRPAEAVRYYTAALALRPNNPGILVNRGLALQAAEETAAAVVEYQRALAIAPDYAVAHNNLGGALRARGRLPEAIEEHRQAIRLRKGFPEAHTALGTALYLQGRLDDAAAAFREAVRIKPEFVKARRGLGLALYDRARFDDAVAAYREAVRIKPDYAEAHYNLGQALGQQGEFREALAALGRGHELGSKRPGWRDAEGRSIRQCERLIELEERLPGHLNGENTPAGPGERVELAVLCTLNRLHAAAAKFYADAFAEEPRLAEDLSSARHRHNAALAAALAGCGSGRDAGGLDAAERARLRRRALDWPRADLAARERLPEPARAAELVAALRHWLADPALAGVRDPEKLLRLPEAERPPWREFWGRVGDTLARAEKASDAN